jgi:hypothetical protein
VCGGGECLLGAKTALFVVFKMLQLHPLKQSGESINRRLIAISCVKAIDIVLESLDGHLAIRL